MTTFGAALARLLRSAAPRVHPRRPASAGRRRGPHGWLIGAWRWAFVQPSYRRGGVTAGARLGRPRQVRRQRREARVAAAIAAAPPRPDETPPNLVEAVRGRVRGAAVQVGGLVLSAAAVVLALSLLAEALLPEAADASSNAFDAELVLPSSVDLQALEERSVVYASDGSVLAVLDREVDRRVVSLASVPEHVKQAVLAAEDQRFYEHKGYDPIGIGRAAFSNLEQRGISQGGSTITQQLAKSAVGDEDTLNRKVLELTYAIRLEEQFTKDELLEQYLNQVFLGGQTYGIAAAAEEFFGIGPEQLTIEQAALLAGMIRSPNATDPRLHPEIAKRRRDATLDAMVALGTLDPAQLEPLKAGPLGVVPQQAREERLPFVVDSVEREFLNDPSLAQFGATPEERQQTLYLRGLHIHTTLDPRLQQIAAEVLADHFAGEAGTPTGAFASIDPVSGSIVAAVGGLAFENEQYDLPTQARRQPGSTFKPFTYAAALMEGVPPSVSLDGSGPKYYEDIPGWTREDGGLENFGNGSYGRLDMRGALTRSVNTATVELSRIVGIERILALTQQMGIDTQASTGGIHNDSIPLGGHHFGPTPVEMASAYSTFANNGIHVQAHFINHIADRDGNVLYRSPMPAAQVLDPRVNAQMIEFMRGVVTGGTGTRADIRGWEVAGKTGTTQDNGDVWFAGYTPVMSTALWIGHPEARIPMRGWSSADAAAVWREYMVRALEGVEPVPWPEGEAGEREIVKGEPVTVPDVVGLGQAQAQRALLDARLGLGRVRIENSDRPDGEVIRQSPDGGEAAESGDTISIGVSGYVPPPEPSEAPAPLASPSATPTPTPTAPAPTAPQPTPEDSGGEDSEEAPAPDPDEGAPEDGLAPPTEGQ